MTYDPGKGALFKNTNKSEDRHPDYQGECNIAGVPHQIAAWLRTSKAGSKYMSPSIRPKEEQAEPAPRTSAQRRDFHDDPF
jgi:hypothetical protein